MAILDLWFSVSWFNLILITGVFLAVFFIVLLVRQAADTDPKLYYIDTPLARHVLKRCSLLREPFRPAPWARNSHVQTILGSLLPDADVEFERQYVELNDGGVVALDWVKPSGSQGPLGETRLLVVLPGLAGNAQGMSHLCKLAVARGYHTLVFNKRGHGGSKLTSPKLQSFGDPADLREIVLHLKSTHPKCALYAIGYSAGSGLLAAYLGEFGSECLVEAAVFVSPGYRLEYLFKKYIPQPYNFIMLRNLKDIVRSHAAMLSKAIDVRKALDARNLAEFEEFLYARIYKTSTMAEHWETNDPMRQWENFAIPGLAISSVDDPVCRKDCIVYSMFTEKGDSMLVTTDRGGHCGFLEGSSLERWADKVSLDYLAAFAEYKETNRANGKTS